MNTNAKDLTKQAATSPRHRSGGYAILSRMADKARADIAGTMATTTPTARLITCCSIGKASNTHGTPKTPEEIRAWSDGVDKATMHGDPEKGAWFDGECQKLGLDGATTTMFEWLDADDRASYAN